MTIKNKAAHREGERKLEQRERAYRRAKVFAAITAARDLAVSMAPRGGGLYWIEPGLLLRLKAALGAAEYLLVDEEGLRI